MKINPDSSLCNFENFLLMGDFNSEPVKETMSDFNESYDLKNLVRVPTGYKNSKNFSCIELFLTN